MKQKADAKRLAPFVANSIAVALGYDARRSADDDLLPDAAPVPRPQPVTIARFGAGTDRRV